MSIGGRYCADDSVGGPSACSGWSLRRRRNRHRHVGRVCRVSVRVEGRRGNHSQDAQRHRNRHGRSFACRVRNCECVPVVSGAEASTGKLDCDLSDLPGGRSAGWSCTEPGGALEDGEVQCSVAAVPNLQCCLSWVDALRRRYCDVGCRDADGRTDHRQEHRNNEWAVARVRVRDCERGLVIPRGEARRVEAAPVAVSLKACTAVSPDKSSQWCRRTAKFTTS